LAERRGIAGVFRFVPQVAPPEIWRYYTMADVLVSCRIRGLNTPLKLYQYVASGKPIVATACPSHTQVLDRSSAELVEPTPGALAAGIIRVLSNPARAAELVAGAARLGRERLREEIYLDRLASLLAEVAGAVPRGERMN
jgi:glycosyltransferase involved in cell wall biosynthesis